ncbi:D-alanyl-D-alanine carboxypeptidase/D-alanyl-D-alanine endopeptidase [Streptomyces coffeae]|uniref:D-alanyl-D-alanine carboxypeptidase/D-alanyl-D-alanine-endopeptidase n=1 Tax=Streptomyces coffeae TaxID=621382 RepID=A0ABS1N577_9ACTN|nr:D-alanyl-D-alanine carboxypeptidase/D-alanyl-D-alanine-endopeptidase [Streptomyces coffeae]MBL1095224.1 D-alanyl-D-alanine carboxypeptidase/D-alanyl-D-alanine-endopeptidase [Streptomyces coffeae]
MPEARSWQVREWLSRGRSQVRNQWRQTTREQRHTARLTAVSATVGLAVAIGSVLVAGPWEAGQRTAERARAAGGPATGGDRPGGDKPAPSASPVLAALGAPTAEPSPDTGEDAVPPPTGAGLADTLEPLLDDPALGDRRSVAVMDVASGRQVFGAKADSAAVPASIIKVATGAAALSALGPDYRIKTTVVEAGKDGIVLVGGGDPTLTARAVKGPDQPASLRKLADDTARALKKRGTRTVRLGYDTSLYSGPKLHPIGVNENIAPVTSLMVDEGRQDNSDHGPAPRAGDPASDAAGSFASMLRDRGIAVTGEPRAQEAGKTPQAVAAVRSQPLSALVERMLTNSDNDLGEALARQTAIAAGQPASFEGGATAVTARLRKLKLPMGGIHIADGSGLDRADRVSAALLAQTLVRSADRDDSALRSVLTGLPVAGFNGTLRTRYAEDSVGRGVVRAKTGTLTGINSLAGTVVDADGRLLVFTFITNGTTDANGAQRALDRMASALANCGCR